jgi:hypothetical protein
MYQEELFVLFFLQSIGSFRFDKVGRSLIAIHKRTIIW